MAERSAPLKVRIPLPAPKKQKTGVCPFFCFSWVRKKIEERPNYRGFARRAKRANAIFFPPTLVSEDALIACNQNPSSCAKKQKTGVCPFFCFFLDVERRLKNARIIGGSRDERNTKMSFTFTLVCLLHFGQIIHCVFYIILFSLLLRFQTSLLRPTSLHLTLDERGIRPKRL